MPKTPPATPQFAPSAPPLANTGVSHDPLGAIPPAIIWVEALGASDVLQKIVACLSEHAREGRPRALHGMSGRALSAWDGPGGAW